MYNKSNIFKEERALGALFDRFVSQSKPEVIGGRAVIEATDFSYTLEANQYVPTALGILNASREKITAVAMDTISMIAKPVNQLMLDPTWQDQMNSDDSANSNYGYALTGIIPTEATGHEFGSQLRNVVDKLIADRSSRQASFIILRREHITSTVDTPCTYGMNFRIRDDKLDVSVHMRSQDAIKCLVPDIAFAKLAQRLVGVMVQTVGPLAPLSVGTIHFSVDSFHMYGEDQTLADNAWVTWILQEKIISTMYLRSVVKSFI